MAIALALGGPASAAADGPLDATAPQAVQQQAGALVMPPVQQAAAIVQDTTGAVTATVDRKPTVAPRGSGGPGAASQPDLAPAEAASAHIRVRTPRLALAEAPPGSLGLQAFGGRPAGAKPFR
jgi:hypothetical protein